MQIGYCFVSRDDWEEWLLVNPDIPSTADYGTWLENIAQFCEDIEASGGRAVQVKVKPPTSPLGAAITGKRSTAAAARTTRRFD